MGVTAMIPDATIGQLLAEGASRWGEIWDPAASRTRVLMMMPRKERKLYEMHGDMVEHGQPVISIFHRPRAEAPLLQEQGLDPRLASFLFVDLASSDLGSWLQHLVTREGWLRSTVEVHPVPFTMGLPNQRRFEIERLLLFRHPDIPAIERYHLPFSVSSLAGKCYVSLPARQAAEHARQQAEVLGVGRLERPAPEPAVEAPNQNQAAMRLHRRRQKVPRSRPATRRFLSRRSRNRTGQRPCSRTSAGVWMKRSRKWWPSKRRPWRFPRLNPRPRRLHHCLKTARSRRRPPSRPSSTRASRTTGAGDVAHRGGIPRPDSGIDGCRRRARRHDGRSAMGRPQRACRGRRIERLGPLC